MTNQQREVVADALPEFSDKFAGDNARLLDSIGALLRLDEAGAFIPHSIGGHARLLLNAAASRLAALATLPTQSAGVEEQSGKSMFDEYSGNHPSIHCYRFPSWGELRQSQRDEWDRKAAALRTPASEGDGGRVVVTTGHCEARKKPGGCPHHNLHCGWPKCDQKTVTTPPPQQEARAVALLREVAEWIDGWEPNFVDDAEWPAVAERIQAITQPGSPT